MEDFKKIIQEHIDKPITIEYGCMGTGYSQILIVSDTGEIKSIGEFLYSFWSKYSTDKGVLAGLEELAKLSEKYRLDYVKKLPSMHFKEFGEIKVS